MCPFHRDKHPSMSFRDGRYHCWVCELQGDSVDFVGRLFGLEPMAAVEKLNTDFSLNLPLHRKPNQADMQAVRRRQEVAEAHRLFEEWREAFIFKLCAAFRVAHIALLGIEAPEDLDKLTEAEVMAIHWQQAFEYWADTMTDGEPKEQMEIFRNRQVIEQRIEQILQNTQTK